MTVGIPPGSGPQEVDGVWLNGLAAGLNATYQSGITAAGTTQGTATQLAGGFTLMELDTVPGSSGVALPAAFAGTEISIYNNTATTAAVYPLIANNPITGTQDTINNGTNFSGGISGHAGAFFFCAKNGVWAAK